MSRIIPAPGPNRILAAVVVFAICVLVYVTAAKAAPPASFPLVATLGSTPSCANVGQTFTVPLTVTNTGKTRAWANITVQGLGDNPYSFSPVGSQPTLQSNTQTSTDYNGQPYSWTTYSWQQIIKPGKSVTFNLVLKMPDWNVQQPPYTDPTTQQVYPAPAPQPYPVGLNFSIGLGQYEAPTHYEGFDVTYCGEPLPVGSGGK